MFLFSCVDLDSPRPDPASRIQVQVIYLEVRRELGRMSEKREKDVLPSQPLLWGLELTPAGEPWGTVVEVTCQNYSAFHPPRGRELGYLYTSF